ncbi:MAG TPA: Ig domain-containing protein, partial [Nitrospira sp.]
SGPTGGTISGTPTTVGTSNFTVMVTDTFSQTVTQNLSITVGELLVTLTVSKSGNGSGLVASLPLGIDCGGACQAVFPRNTVVTLTAAPNDFSRFNQWSGIGCSGNGQCILTMDGDKQVDAKFAINLIFGIF